MKNQFFKVFNPVYVFLIGFILITSCTDEHTGAIHQHFKTKKELVKVLKKFAVSEEEKDAETHRNLFLSSSSSVNFVLKNNGNPNIASLSRDQWIGFFTSWDYEYFPKYSNVKFFIDKGIALDSHHFQGVRDGVDDLYGNDLFLYAKTTSGWKIVSLASTIVTPDDTTDYDTIPGIDKAPDQFLLDFESSFNLRNESAFKELFVSDVTPCFTVDTVFEDEYMDAIHSAKGFFENASADLEIHFFNIKSSVKDQFTAVLSSSYSITDKNNEIVREGELLSSLVGTIDTSWKITGIVFSAE